MARVRGITAYRCSRCRVLMEEGMDNDLNTSVIGPTAIFALLGTLCDDCVVWLAGELKGAEIRPVRRRAATGRLQEILIPEQVRLAREDSG